MLVGAGIAIEAGAIRLSAQKAERTIEARATAGALDGLPLPGKARDCPGHGASGGCAFKGYPGDAVIAP